MLLLCDLGLFPWSKFGPSSIRLPVGESSCLDLQALIFHTLIPLYNTGARFGPRAIRAASSRQTSFRGFNHRAALNPYSTAFEILDCGDIPVTPLDNGLALRQMSEAYLELGSRHTAINPRPNAQSSSSSSSSTGSASSSDGIPAWSRPKLITLGGDHSLALPALRALSKIHGQPISILHFDAHLDTWHPSKYPSSWVPDGTSSDKLPPSAFNHGSMFHLASVEGLIHNTTSVHAGLRSRLSGTDYGDYFDDDDRAGFLRIHADDLDDLGGPTAITKLIMQRIGTRQPVYLSVDIDVLDPGLAPGTGTPEPGGWTTRELIRILRGVEGLNVVGADLVEVAPMYAGGGAGEATTALAAAHVGYEIMTSMVKRGLEEMYLHAGYVGDPRPRLLYAEHAEL